MIINLFVLTNVNTFFVITNVRTKNKKAPAILRGLRLLYENQFFYEFTLTKKPAKKAKLEAIAIFI